MTINHLNLIVTDVTNAVKLFETYFDFNCEFIKGENGIAVLKNMNNFTLVIMNNKQDDITYPKDFHFGFITDNSAQVDNLYKKLVDGKLEIIHPPRKIRDSYTFYFHFDNLFIEVGHYLQ